jgi:hypothetical protein
VTGLVHLNGGVNLETPEEVFDQAGSLLGSRLKRVPDGEPGGRRQWISYQYPVIRSNAFLQAGDREQPWQEYPSIRLREGATPEQIRFGHLGYAREAKVSYDAFVDARERGRLPHDCRFMVALPTPFAPALMYSARDSFKAIEAAYERGMVREVDRILQYVPAEDLSLQWDVCMEMLMYDNRIFKSPWPDMNAGLRERFSRLGAAVPGEAELGFHLCYGDRDKKHLAEPDTLAAAVSLANLISSAVRRPVHWIHMPVPIGRNDDEYFKPLTGLDLHRETELVLGVVHLKDGIDGTLRRIMTAKKYVKRFGVGTECGMGRSFATEDIPALLRIHAAAADIAGA